MNKTFHLGRRFQNLKKIALVLYGALVFCFYFIYRFLLVDSFPQLVGLPLVCFCVVLWLIIAKVTSVIFRKIEEQVSYTVAQDALVVKKGRVEKRYRWKDFTVANLAPVFFTNRFPVTFTCKGEEFQIMQSLDGLYDLHALVFAKIEGYVSLDPDMVQTAQNMKGL